MTPAPVPPPPDAVRYRRRLAQVYRNVWFTLMETADDLRLDRESALNLTEVVAQLTSMGYTLNSDETDWQPKESTDAT